MPVTRRMVAQASRQTEFIQIGGNALASGRKDDTAAHLPRLAKHVLGDREPRETGLKFSRVADMKSARLSALLVRSDAKSVFLGKRTALL